MNENRPEFWKAWQAMTLVSSTMLESQMLNTLFAYNAFHYFFYDQDMVNVAVLPIREDYFNETSQAAIYTDSRFGMNSVRKLITWIIAADGPNKAHTPQRVAYDLILNHFES